MALEELKNQLLHLTPAEKLEVIRMLASELAGIWPGIEELPPAAGGFGCVTRGSYSFFPVWVLEGYRRAGWSDAQILAKFPDLTATDLGNAWIYAQFHLDQMAEALRENTLVDALPGHAM